MAAENEATLKRKLKSILTETFYERSRTNDRAEIEESLRRIQGATEILNSLKNEELKKLDIASSAFKRPLSNQSMLKSVIISTGQTYDVGRCPESKAVVTHASMTKNRRSEELVIQLSPADIDSLLVRISTPSSDSDQLEAADELQRQLKSFAYVREIFVGVGSLLKPLSTLDNVVFTNHKLQEKIINALFYISVNEDGKTLIVDDPVAFPVLAKCLEIGSDHSIRCAAWTLWSLSVSDSIKTILGNSVVLIKSLIGLLEEGEFVATQAAASAMYNICLVKENRERAVRFCLIHVLVKRIRAGNANELLRILGLLSTDDENMVQRLEGLGFINDVLMVLQAPYEPLAGENAVVIIFNMSQGKIRDMKRLRMLRAHEDEFKSFTKLASQGTSLAVTKAKAILDWFRQMA